MSNYHIASVVSTLAKCVKSVIWSSADVPRVRPPFEWQARHAAEVQACHGVSVLLLRR